MRYQINYQIKILWTVSSNKNRISKRATMLSLIVVMGCMVLSTGCATWKKWMGDEPENSMPLAQQPQPPPVDETLRFSENPNIGTFNERRYKRATRKSLEEDSDVGSRAGSLWNTEGTSAYLFTQNKVHREGDLLNVKLEGNAKAQMDSKIQVIKKLLARIEIVPSTPPSAPGQSVPLAENANGDGRSPASATNSGAPTNGNAGGPTTAAVPSSPSPANTKGNGAEATPSSELEAPIQVDSVATRVTERMADGNYRVKGQQSFMIGKKEFKVIITGLVRPEDFMDEGISSNKLLDPQLDIVSLRRSLQ